MRLTRYTFQKGPRNGRLVTVRNKLLTVPISYLSALWTALNAHIGLAVKYIERVHCINWGNNKCNWLTLDLIYLLFSWFDVKWQCILLMGIIDPSLYRSCAYLHIVFKRRSLYKGLDLLTLYGLEADIRWFWGYDAENAPPPPLQNTINPYLKV